MNLTEVSSLIRMRTRDFIVTVDSSYNFNYKKGKN